jgi:hypothetical protein
LRLWSFHPLYLDSRGLVALWRESLLALHVLQNKTTGYRNHPQLTRFKESPDPLLSIAYYLHAIHEESVRREYSFNGRKIPKKDLTHVIPLTVTIDQLSYEWEHFKKKLKKRDKKHLASLLAVEFPDCHPLFTPIPGHIEKWEKV